MKNHAAECVQLTRRAAALLAAVLALTLLAGCAGGESQPVVTNDDLTPNSAVQTVLDLDAGNGKTYAYVMDPDDFSFLSWEEAKEKALEQAEKAVQSVKDMLAEAKAEENTTDEELEMLQTELDAMQSEDGLDATLTWARQRWEEQQDLDPVILPQEAANRAGCMLEDAYGIDLTGKELVLTCSRAPGSGRVQWEVRTKFEEFGGNIYCDLDATTGEFIHSGYAVLTDEENERILQSPKPDCYVVTSNGMAYWDPNAPSYQQTMETLKAEAQSAISGSPLVNGAAVTGIEAELVLENCLLHLRLTCDNGKTYILSQDGYGAGCTGYDYGGYPLRAYSFGDIAFWNNLGWD